MKRPAEFDAGPFEPARIRVSRPAETMLVVLAAGLGAVAILLFLNLLEQVTP